jgi:hypothetical protein
MSHRLNEQFKEIHKVFEIYLSVAISSTDPERSFSCLRRLKSYLRNKMHDHIRFFSTNY